VHDSRTDLHAEMSWCQRYQSSIEPWEFEKAMEEQKQETKWWYQKDYI